MSGSPVSSLRDRKPNEERIPQPFSSFIFPRRIFKHGLLCFCFHRCSLVICSMWQTAVLAMLRSTLWWIPRCLRADVDVVFYLLCRLAGPSSSFLLRGGSLSLPPVCHSITIQDFSQWWKVHYILLLLFGGWQRSLLVHKCNTFTNTVLMCKMELLVSC